MASFLASWSRSYKPQEWEGVWWCPEAGESRGLLGDQTLLQVSIVSRIPLTFLGLVHTFSSLLLNVSWDRRKRRGTLFPNLSVLCKGLLLSPLPYHIVSCVLSQGGWEEGGCGAGHHIGGMHTHFKAHYIQSEVSGTWGNTEIKEGTGHILSQAFTYTILFTPLISLL